MTVPTHPLIAHASPDAAVAWRKGVAIPVAQFLADVAAVADALPPGGHVLNLCRDRYHFAVSFAACVITRRVSLLPSTHTPEVVRQMQALTPDVFCISDQADTGVALPTYRYPAAALRLDHNARIPAIACDQVVAEVFTSGSTGLPVAHTKRWGSLVRNAQAEAQRLGVGAGYAVLGTVPPQHMYGLESTLMMPWQCGGLLHAGHPFFPADICSQLSELPRPRMLVTTPFHLRTVLAEQDTLPALDQILSATAPLSLALALDAEARTGAPLHEIYGCTESGQIASRRTAREAAWLTLPDVHLGGSATQAQVAGGHVEVPTALGDVIEPLGEGPPWTRFLLHGRHADLVNIAGKRTSLAYLNHQLNAISGVVDGVFLQTGVDDPHGVGRLTALVVAPTLTPAAITSALRSRIDPIFLPRPLLFVDALPRNATGKLPSQMAQTLLSNLQGEVRPRALT